MTPNDDELAQGWDRMVLLGAGRTPLRHWLRWYLMPWTRP